MPVPFASVTFADVLWVWANVKMITATRNSAQCLHLTQLFLSDGGHINEKLPAGAMTETDQGKVQFSAAQPFSIEPTGMRAAPGLYLTQMERNQWKQLFDPTILSQNGHCEKGSSLNLQKIQLLWWTNFFIAVFLLFVFSPRQIGVTTRQFSASSPTG